jgi:hypothetical protein
VRIGSVKHLGCLAFNILAIPSLLLCMAVCVLWAASYRRMEGDKLSAQLGYDPNVMAYLHKVAEAAKGPACTRLGSDV